MYGLINLHKPAGWTSHDCVAKLRRLLKQKRVGHGGTLDPAATGVLPIAVGQATRLLQYLPANKAYRGRVRFGLTTNTDDLEGEVLTQQDPVAVTRQATPAALAELLPQFMGTLEQIPPRYSAIQVAGKRLYDRARQGEAFEVPTRKVEVTTIEICHWFPGDDDRYPEVELAIACGPGTYIRSIARDLGEMLGVGGTLASLVRTRSCGLILEESLGLEAIAAQLATGQFPLLDPALFLGHLPALRLGPELARRWCFGQKLPLETTLLAADPTLSLAQLVQQVTQRVETETGHLLGIAEIRQDEMGQWLLAPKLVLNPVS